MGFSAPLWLLLGLGLFAAILLMHSRSWRLVEVGSLSIWNRLAPTGGRSQRMRRPVPSLLLFLQLAAAAILSLALADPFLGTGQLPDHRIFIVDASGPMQATDGGTPGTILAETALAAELRRHPASAKASVSIVRAGTTASLVLAEQSWIGEVANLGADDGAADWADAAALARRLTDAGESTAVTVISYTANPTAAAALPGARAIEVMPDPTTGNASIAGELVPLDTEGRSWRIDGRLSGALPALDGVPVTLTFTPRGIDASIVLQEVIVPANPGNFSIEVLLPGPGILVLAGPGDAVAFDDRQVFVVGPSSALRVLAAGNVPTALLRALEATGRATIEAVGTLPDNATGYDLVVAASDVLAALPTTNILVVAPPAAGTAASMVPPAAFDRDHPLSRAVDWAAMAVPPDRGLPLLGGATTLLETSEAALVQARTTANGREVVVAFDIARSNWPALASLPIFVANLLDWIAPRANSCIVGTFCDVDPRAVRGTLVDPAGNALPWPAGDLAAAGDGALPRGATVGFVPTSAGLYRTVVSGRTDVFAVRPDLPAPPAVSVPPPLEQAGDGGPFRLWTILLAAGLVVLIAEKAVSWRRPENRGLGSRSRIAAAAIRAATVLLLAAALAELPAPSVRDAESRAMVLPGPGLARGPGDEAFLAAAAGDRASVVTDAGVQSLFGAADAAAPETQPRTAGRPFADSLALAVATLPPDTEGHVLVRSDAAAGEAVPAAIVASIINRGIVVDVVAAEPPAFDVALAAIDVPAGIREGDAVDLIVTVRATAAAAATLIVRRDGATISEDPIALTRGANRVEVAIGTAAVGQQLFEIEVVAEGDEVSENNRDVAIIVVGPAPRVAIMTEDPGAAAAFAAMLSVHGIEAVEIAARSAPYTADRWMEHDVVALLNLPAIALASAQQEALREAVEVHGRGLLLLGGENTFGPGGYYQTPLEQLSPLSSRVPRDTPRTALVFVLDRSGSMQQMVGEANRLAIARAATLNAMALLHPEGEVSVIAFDSEAQTVLPLRQIGDMAGIEPLLDTIQPGGGTSMHPGLVLALEQLRGAEAAIRHVIVMTDGLSQPGDFDGILAELRAIDATVSTVAIGSGLDTDLLETIARLGNGAFHEAEDVGALPSILSQEAMLLSGSPIELGTTQPSWTAPPSGVFAGLPLRLPSIEGFVTTTPKPDARLVLTVTDAEGVETPLLATWRAGNGFVVAVPTHAVGPWTAAWNAMAEYPLMWAQIVRAAVPETTQSTIELTRSGDVVTARVDAAKGAVVEAFGIATAEGLAIGQEGRVTSSGRELAVHIDGPGVYVATAKVDGGPVTAPFAVAYASSFAADALGGDWIEALRRATGGVLVTSPDAALFDGPIAIAWQKAWRPFALLAVLFFAVELFIRTAAPSAWRSRRRAATPTGTAAQAAG